MLDEIQKRLPGFPLVMHGSSSVPQEEVARINAAGGKLKGAKGVDENQFKRAAELGVTKINIDTDGRLVWTRVHREFFRDYPGEVRPARSGQDLHEPNTPSSSRTRTRSSAAPARSRCWRLCSRKRIGRPRGRTINGRSPGKRAETWVFACAVPGDLLFALIRRRPGRSDPGIWR